MPRLHGNQTGTGLRPREPGSVSERCFLLKPAGCPPLPASLLPVPLPRHRQRSDRPPDRQGGQPGAHNSPGRGTVSSATRAGQEGGWPQRPLPIFLELPNGWTKAGVKDGSEPECVGGAGPALLSWPARTIRARLGGLQERGRVGRRASLQLGVNTANSKL